MLKVFRMNGIYVPALCCDYCEQHIDNPRIAGYFYDVTQDGEPLKPVYLLHKRCADKVEAVRGKFRHWDEMAYLLERLSQNAQPLVNAVNDYDVHETKGE